MVSTSWIVSILWGMLLFLVVLGGIVAVRDYIGTQLTGVVILVSLILMIVFFSKMFGT